MNPQETNLKDANVFLSGPMTGCEYNNVESFARAHAVARALGARHVYDPTLVWLHQPQEDDETLTHEDYMRRCVHELTRPGYGEHSQTFYDVLVSLPEWWMSVGASHEHDVAEQCGIRCIDLDVLEGAVQHECR